MKLIAILLFAAVLSGTEQVTIEELGQSDVDAIKKAESDIEEAHKQLTEASMKFQSAQEARTQIYSSIQHKYGQTFDLASCKGQEKQHAVTVEIRGKYVVIAEDDYPCGGAGFYSYSGGIDIHSGGSGGWHNILSKGITVSGGLVQQ